jgi:4'-phosphopantetheinyl transferase
MHSVQIIWAKYSDVFVSQYAEVAPVLLAPDEYLRLSQYARESDRYLSLLAKLILFLEAENVGIHLPDLKTLAIDTFGKPWLASNPDMNFNISHSGDITLVAIASGQRVGVDVEHCQRDFLSSVSSEFTPEENSWIKSDPNRLLKLWTRKEAALKAEGRGLQHDPGAIEVLTSPVKVGDVNFFWKDLDIEANYTGAVAFEKANSSVSMRRFIVDDLFFDRVWRKLRTST